ncbi:HNH endonuclease signature motif containing protein [Arthrobacter sp. SX1312]|uniref:HNH endonuclease signature motif containing protein n=1 Tax=Arthrobacter sp. SX1312 TaxID=2058896 RepID=UPI000CE558AD|nr:HNH endonuclease signature motif containing protein [Arthrobacter sp. SX1312]
MTTAPVEGLTAPPDSLDVACTALAECARGIGQVGGTRSRQDAVDFLLRIEHASRIMDHLQILAARLAEDHHLADSDDERQGGGSLLARAEQSVSGNVLTGPATDTSPASPGNEFRNCTDFLRATLGISRAEAKRRLCLADVLLPRISPTGAPVPARLSTLGAAVTSGRISGRAATVVAQALQRVESFATPQHLESMEHHLTRQAMEADEDILRVLARRWEGVLDQDGQEPTDKVLRARQGVFFRGRRHGLHFVEIGATDEQFELLATVMNSAANPRGPSGRTDAAAPGGGPGSSGPSRASDVRGVPCTRHTGAHASHDRHSSDDRDADESRAGFVDPRMATRAQALLDGLVAACRVALSTAALPSTGGHRPQIMVTIDHRDLIGASHRAGYAVFSGQMSAGSIRKLACDADIIPLVLGGKGQVLDIGRAQRLFPPHLRRALVARDKGCAFPDCSIPAAWCEAHHLKPWSRGGATSIDNGVLLCSRHHHVIHQGAWTVQSRQGIPWFTAPRTLGPPRSARRNRYWQAGQSVDEALVEDASELTPHVSEHTTDSLEHSTG